MMTCPEIDISNATIKTERLLLRPFKESDLNDFYEYAKVPGVGEAAGWPHHESLEESKTILNMFIDEKKTFAITELTSSKVIGSLGIERPSFRLDCEERITVREIGYALAKEKWGKGYMTEAVKAVISYCFETLGLDALECCHFSANDRSRRVIEKCGFHYVLTNQYHSQMGTSVKENKCYLLYNPKRSK